MLWWTLARTDRLTKEQVDVFLVAVNWDIIGRKIHPFFKFVDSYLSTSASKNGERWSLSGENLQDSHYIK